jgi:hypothetical protein
VRRVALVAAVLLAAARGAAAQLDTTGRAPPGPDSTARDTVTRYLPVHPIAAPSGPAPRGSRYTFTQDSMAFSDTKTLSDLLAHIPGVYVARGGLYGQAEGVLFGGRGPAALEVYWDGVPYLPLGRDSVYLDPARIPLAPLERVEVVVLPAALRVYLITRRQSSTAPSSEVGITTGQFGTSGYRAAFLKRWRSGAGLSLVADWSDIGGASGSSTTPFHDVDLWLKGEYLPSPRIGASYQVVSSDWHRTGSDDPLVDPSRSKRVDGVFRGFLAARDNGLGPRADLSVARASLSGDTAVAAGALTQVGLELSTTARRASAGLAARYQEHRSPFTLEARAAWSPIGLITFSADARHATYEQQRTGSRAHLSAGIDLPFGLSAHGDLAWAKDLQAPSLADDTVQATTDVSGAVRWQRSWVTLEVGGGRRGAFTPSPEFPTGLRGVAALDATPATNYLTAYGRLRPLPGLELSAWYFDPRGGGGDFEPPHHARASITFYSKFWRVYRSGIFALRVEGAGETWSGGGRAGFASDAGGTTLPLAPATFVDVNVQMRIAGVTIYWATRNARAFRGGYLPGADYPRNYQFYGVLWRFTN